MRQCSAVSGVQPSRTGVCLCLISILQRTVGQHSPVVSLYCYHQKCGIDNASFILTFIIFSITAVLIVFTSSHCWLRAGFMSISVGPLTPDWPFTAMGRLTGLTCWWRELWREGEESVSETLIRLSSFSLYPSICQSFSVSASLSLTFCLIVSPSLCWVMQGGPGQCDSGL